MRSYVPGMLVRNASQRGEQGAAGCTRAYLFLDFFLDLHRGTIPRLTPSARGCNGLPAPRPLFDTDRAASTEP